MNKEKLIKTLNIISYIALTIVILVLLSIALLFIVSRSALGLNNQDEEFMALAYQEAALALPSTDYPVGAVLVIDNQVIAKAHNTVHFTNDSRNHAEMLVINEVLNKYNAGDFSQIKGKITLYTTLEPCPMCEGYIIWKKVPRIVVGKNKPVTTVFMENIFSHLIYRWHQRGGLNADQQTGLENNYYHGQAN